MEKAKKQKKEPYTSPVVRIYGTLEKLTKMPGGSVFAEGASGKDHRPGPPRPVVPPRPKRK